MRDEGTVLVSSHGKAYKKEKLKPSPLYLQLEDDLKRRIEIGEFKPGECIPSEHDLEQIYSVSRVTVREAIARLVAMGYLKKERGKGTFVLETQKIDEYIGYITSFTEEIIARGYTPSSKTLSFRVDMPPQRIAEMLQIDKAEKVVVLERIRYVDGEPISISKDFVPEKLVPGLIERGVKEESFYKDLEMHYGFKMKEAVEEVEAILPTTNQAKLLQIPPSYPVLQAHRVIFGGPSMQEYTGKPIAGLVSIFRGDRFKYWARLRNRNKGVDI